MHRSPAPAPRRYRVRWCPGPTAASSTADRTKSSRARAQSPALASFLVKLLPGRADLLIDLALVNRIAVAGKGAGEGSDRCVVASELEQHVAVMILDDRVGAQLIRGALQILLR